MSERQTKAGNQSLNVIENLKNLKTFKPLKMILMTCGITFVFMSMLKSRCLLVKIAMLFLPLPRRHPAL